MERGWFHGSAAADGGRRTLARSSIDKDEKMKAEG